MQKKDCMQHASYREFPAFKRDRAMAVTFSFLFHIVVAGFLYMLASETLLPVIGERFQIIHVTWVDASYFPDRNSLVVNSETVKSPPTAVKQISNSHKERPLPGKPLILSAQEEKRQAVILNSSGQEQVPAAGGQVSAALQTDSASKHIVALEHDLKNYGADSHAANTSMVKPRYRENAPPPYPLSARLRGFEGVAVIAAEILADGRTGNLKIKSSSGYGILDQSAVEAVKAWKFDPARERGKPVSAWVEIPIRFVLKSGR